MKSIIYDNVAMLTNTRNDQQVECEVDNVQESKSLNAFVAGNKIHMRWNGKIFVGNAHGMEFTTPGPAQRQVKGRNF